MNNPVAQDRRSTQQGGSLQIPAMSSGDIVAAERDLRIKGLKDIDISNWNLGPSPEYGQIVTLEQYVRCIKPTLEGKRIVATSGGFDPIQPGHSSCIIDSQKFGDVVVVIVNGDWFLEAKKNPKSDVGMENLRQRCQVVSHIRGVDFVIPFEIEGDSSMCEALKAVRPHVFTKGGDRSPNQNPIPEDKVCERYAIEVAYGVGSRKVDSSSWIADSYFQRRLRLLAQRSENAKNLLEELGMPVH